VSIGSNSKLRNVCIDSNTTVEDDTLIEDSVIYFGARIGRGCKIIRSIIDRFGDTGEKTQVGDYEPDETTVVGAYTKLGDGWYMWPGELIARYSPEARKQIVSAKRYHTNLYKIIGDDEKNLYFVDRTVLTKTYNNLPPPIFNKVE
jgi:NDP-sugar pyrophosphorylase family protein